MVTDGQRWLIDWYLRDERWRKGSVRNRTQETLAGNKRDWFCRTSLIKSSTVWPINVVKLVVNIADNDWMRGVFSTFLHSTFTSRLQSLKQYYHPTSNRVSVRSFLKLTSLFADGTEQELFPSQNSPNFLPIICIYAFMCDCATVQGSWYDNYGTLWTDMMVSELFTVACKLEL